LGREASWAYAVRMMCALSEGVIGVRRFGGRPRAQWRGPA
jgi:hypothetical protein